MMADILFDAGSSKISKNESKKLEILACRMTDPNAKLEVALVIGHADLLEKDEVRLGWYRVVEVKEALIGMGVAPAKIYIESKGNKEARGQSGEESAANRRVEIEVLFNRASDVGLRNCGD